MINKILNTGRYQAKIPDISNIIHFSGDQKTQKKIYSAICKAKIDYGCQVYNTASAGRLKKLDSIHREGIIYKQVPSKLHQWNLYM